MHYAHTFLPNKNKKNKNFLIYQTFSFLFLKKQNLKINLYAEEDYLNICKDIGLNYDNFIEIHKNEYQENYWSHSKMQALKLNNDIIIDHDLFLLKDVSNYIDNQDLIYSHNEYIKKHDWYKSDPLLAFKKTVPKNKILEWDYLIDSFYDNNNSIKEAADLNYAFNCCIIGFKDKQIAMDYANKSLTLFEYLNKNNANISTLKDNHFLPTIAEQLFLSFYSKYHNLETFNFSNDTSNSYYIHLGSEKYRYHKDILKFIKVNAPNIYQNLLKYIV